MTYADRVYPDGREMRAEDFKETPEGHTGGALNIVPAYVGYLGRERAQWVDAWLVDGPRAIASRASMPATFWWAT
ncbi:hypothetical protein ACPA9J_03665 [Pseudomonas aeruginosa]